MSKPTPIIPTIGRRLWYIPSAYDRGHMETKPETIIQANSSQPCDAGVVYVHSDRMVNLVVTDHNGNIHKRNSVTLFQPGDVMPAIDGGYAVWMTYQQAQAQPKAQGSTTTKYFAFCHLPQHLQVVSKPLAELSELIEMLLPNGPEKSAGMRKLLEAKDCFVRAALDMSPTELIDKAPITDHDRMVAWVFVMSNGESLPQDLANPLADVLEAEVKNEEELLVGFKLFLDGVVKHMRSPEQHTEGPDHAPVEG